MNKQHKDKNNRREENGNKIWEMKRRQTRSDWSGWAEKAKCYAGSGETKAQPDFHHRVLKAAAQRRQRVKTELRLGGSCQSLGEKHLGFWALAGGSLEGSVPEGGQRRVFGQGMPDPWRGARYWKCRSWELAMELQPSLHLSFQLGAQGKKVPQK